jgi:YVTN family beta-propeller protein
MRFAVLGAQSVAVLVLLVGAAACTQPSASHATYAAGTLALSADGSQIYVADADNNQVLVVDASKKTVLHRVTVGNSPSHLLTAPDGRVFVSNRQSRSVSVVDAAKGTVVGTIAVGTEPTGLAMTSDGKTLLVANTTNASVSVVDVPSLTEKMQIATEADPNEISLLTDSKAYVTHIRSGDVSTIDVSSAKVMRVVNTSAPAGILNGQNRHSEGPTDIVIPPRGGFVYQPNQLALLDTIQTQPVQQQPPPSNSYSGGVSSSGTVAPPVVTPGLATLDSTQDTLVVGAGLGGNLSCPNCGAGVLQGPTTSTANSAPITVNTHVPPMVLTPIGIALSGPSAAVADPNGKFLYITHLNSNNVAVVWMDPSKATSSQSVDPTTGIQSLPTGVFEVISVGAAPNGIAIPASDDRAYVYNSFDHSISILGPDSAGQSIIEQSRFTVGSTSLTPEQDLGRRLFFSANDPRMTSTAAGGIACGSCHLQGREDGRTWQFSEGPRNTPTVAGRHLGTTAPYHWDGNLADMQAFNGVIVNRMGGVGDGTTAANGGQVAPLTDEDFNALLAFMDSQARPDNPNVGSTLSAAAQRGQALFEGAAQCITCHSGADYTDNSFHDVGSLSPSEVASFNGPSGSFRGVNTPALHNLFYSAPYLHDGSKVTLLDRVSDDANGQHGHTTSFGMTPDQLNDLVAYLQTL